MASVRVADLALIKERGQELMRIGEELQGYGMFYYGGIVLLRGKEIVQTVAKYQPKVVE